MEVVRLTDVVSAGDGLKVLNANLSPVKQPRTTLAVPPPKEKQQLNFGAIGTAYDYWVRTQLAPERPNLVETFLGYQVCWFEYRHSREAQKLLHEHANALRMPPRTEDQNILALSACLFLAKFEASYRSGVTVDRLDVIPGEVAELERLASVTELANFRRQPLILNPIFCVQGSKARILADGDLLAGSCLVDLKTSSAIKLKDNLRQLIGYVMLNDLGRYGRAIESVAVYYPRFKYFFEVPLSTLMSPKQQNAVSVWFKNQLGLRLRACKAMDV